MSTRILTRTDVAALITLPDCIAVVEDAFRRFGLNEVARPGVMGVHVSEGGFHVKAAVLECPRPYFAAKLNANFPANPDRHGLPTIQGVLALCDARSLHRHHHWLRPAGPGVSPFACVGAGPCRGAIVRSGRRAGGLTGC